MRISKYISYLKSQHFPFLISFCNCFPKIIYFSAHLQLGIVNFKKQIMFEKPVIYSLSYFFFYLFSKYYVSLIHFATMNLKNGSCLKISEFISKLICIFFSFLEFMNFFKHVSTFFIIVSRENPR